MKNKTMITMAMIALIAAIGTMTISTNINAFAREEPSTEQLQSNCRHGNQGACDALGNEGTGPGSPGGHNVIPHTSS